MPRLCIFFLLSLCPTFAQSDEARRLLDLGVQAYRQYRYEDAARFFQTAVQAEPQFMTAKLYLASAYMMQYIPGADSEENLLLAKQATAAFMAVLEQDPSNTDALESVAKLYFHQQKLEEAEEWYRKLMVVAPTHKTAFYTLGVIAWTRTFPPRMQARAKLGMRPDDPGPIPDYVVREELKTKNLPVIQRGMEDLSIALTLDPEYDDAMAYMNLLYRERADLADDREGYKRDTDTADEWVDKTLATKKAKVTAAPPR